MQGETSERRKAEHLRINLEQDVSFPHLTTGLECYRFVHCALPEIALQDVDITTSFLGKTLRAPILISSMTGGTADALRLNRHLAETAQATGIALGLGSLRPALEKPQLTETYRVRSLAPDVLVLANLGAAQLGQGLGVEDCRRVVDLIGADGLILHLNPLQEALQPGGDTDWRGLLARIEQVCRNLAVPVLVKEVGWGISAGVAQSLADAGVAAIDVAGAGGTSWSQVEMYRASSQGQRRLCSAFADWGIPTAEALVGVRAVLPEMPLVASGGLRNGMDVAKALALGADLCGLAGPFLKAANVSTDAATDLVGELVDTLRVVLFCLGMRNLTALKGAPVLQSACCTGCGRSDRREGA